MQNQKMSTGCGKDDLTGTLSWMLQGVLAGLAFTCLIGMIGFLL